MSKVVRKYYKYKVRYVPAILNSLPTFSSATEASEGKEGISFSPTTIYPIIAQHNNTAVGNSYGYDVIFTFEHTFMLQTWSFQGWVIDCQMPSAGVSSVQGSNDLSSWTSISNNSSNTTYYKYYKFTFVGSEQWIYGNMGLNYLNMTGSIMVEEIYTVEATPDDYDFYEDVVINNNAKKEIIRHYYKHVETQIPNGTTVGSMNIINGVISNFSSSRYLALPSNFNGSIGDTWEMVFKVKLNNLATTWNGILSYSTCQAYSARLSVMEGSYARLLLATDTSGSATADIKGITVLEPNIDYWIKAEFTGSDYNLYISTDGTTYSLEGTVSNTSKWTTYTLSRVGIFGDNNSTEYSFDGSIDLNQSYIKADGNYWWKGTKTITIECTADDDYDYYVDKPTLYLPKINNKFYSIS